MPMVPLYAMYNASSDTFIAAPAFLHVVHPDIEGPNATGTRPPVVVDYILAAVPDINNATSNTTTILRMAMYDPESGAFTGSTQRLSRPVGILV